MGGVFASFPSACTGNTSTSIMGTTAEYADIRSIKIAQGRFITAVPLSKKNDAPILMTSSIRMSNVVLHEIQSSAETVFIIGGTGTISEEIESELQSFGITTNRLEGANRYDTAAKIGDLVGMSDTVYLAYGYGEPDALAAALAAKVKGCVLTVPQDSLPSAVKFMNC
ncbi:cell wall-binding repeat-containing protein [Desulfitobacterium sp. PCE1]|uniref:cell wall-binding repeat-containing protein n=1 Tax=Desulfitobacterium sp. PCE1 TaxID=146907 RepID=UPI000377CDE7|nr:cell wall-binding repeat-containing protein [Desulfitobacterium sp. PCE1]